MSEIELNFLILVPQHSSGTLQLDTTFSEYARAKLKVQMPDLPEYAALPAHALSDENCSQIQAALSDALGVNVVPNSPMTLHSLKTTGVAMLTKDPVTYVCRLLVVDEYPE